MSAAAPATMRSRVAAPRPPAGRAGRRPGQCVVPALEHDWHLTSAGCRRRWASPTGGG